MKKIRKLVCAFILWIFCAGFVLSAIPRQNANSLEKLGVFFMDTRKPIISLLEPKPLILLPQPAIYLLPAEGNKRRDIHKMLDPWIKDFKHWRKYQKSLR